MTRKFGNHYYNLEFDAGLEAGELRRAKSWAALQRHRGYGVRIIRRPDGYDVYATPDPIYLLAEGR